MTSTITLADLPPNVTRIRWEKWTEADMIAVIEYADRVHDRNLLRNARRALRKRQGLAGG